MKSLVLVLAVFLVGCASVSGLRDQAPDVQLHTSKTPAQFGQCVANGWGEFFGVTVNHSATSSGGYTVSMPNAYTGNNGVVDITSAGDVSVRYRLSSLGGYDKFTKVVNDCK